MPDNELLGAVYHAASDPQRWRDVLTRVKERFAARAVLLARHDLETGLGECLFESGLDPRYAYRFGESAPLNPWMRETGVFQPHNVVAGEDVLSNADLMQQEFYRRFLRPQHCLHHLCGVAVRRGDEIWVVSLFRPPDQPVFSDGDRRTLARLLPHFERSLELRWGIERERSGRRALLDLLDQLPTAILVVDGGGHPLMVNAAAEHVLALNDGLVISAKRLRAVWHVESEQLQRIVGDACASGHGHQAGGHLAITRPSGRRPFLVIVNPLPRAIVDFTGRDRSVAAIVVKDPEAATQTSPNSRGELAELYELTPAEGRLAGLILDGLCLFEAAEHLGISKNTARTHMKRIYAKTGTHRQADLVRRLSHLATNP